MRKKLILIALLAMIISMTGCNANKENNQTYANNKSKETKTEIVEKSDFEEALNRVKTYNELENKTWYNAIQTGNYIKFGEYQGEKLNWIVMEKQEDKALLFNANVIDCKCYNEYEYCECTWETSSLRNWLNDDFYNTAFSNEEKNKILLTNVNNNDDIDFDASIKSGNNTDDYIFCLSRQENWNYFGQDTELVEKRYGNKTYSIYVNLQAAAGATDYAKNVDNYGNKLSTTNESELDTVLDMMGKKDDGFLKRMLLTQAAYWLRSHGDDVGCASYVDQYGENFSGVLSGGTMNAGNVGVRPAMWVKFK